MESEIISMKKIYGQRIRNVLLLKDLTQKQLAIKLANNEKSTLASDKGIEDLTDKYVNLVNRWVNFKAEPELKSLQAIGDVLNIADSYLVGEIHRPVAKFFEGEERDRWDNFVKELHLFKFIEQDLKYNIDYIVEDGNGGSRPVFYQILDFTRCVLSKYLDDIGAKKKMEAKESED